MVVTTKAWGGQKDDVQIFKIKHKKKCYETHSFGRMIILFARVRASSIVRLATWKTTQTERSDSVPFDPTIPYTLVIIIIIIRPKPAYDQQGLVGSWGQDTDQAGTFWGVVNISLRAFCAQLGWRLT